jgi:hypothetical protein
MIQEAGVTYNNRAILRGLQEAVDADCPGYSVVHYVAIVGLESLNEDGTLISGIGIYTPEGQADYISVGLMWDGDTLRASENVEDTGE